MLAKVIYGCNRLINLIFMWIKLPNQGENFETFDCQCVDITKIFDSQMNFVSYNQADSVSFGL
ncbi:hypothetical protein BV912_07330 [Neisseria dumasiana]|uniref:Uncharacterized protein n=1 Tax=Neisseria dumasiana TaxID=1931275 RepID=A0A1X3DHJ4_9NEIS|nr:hypothetical protein BV912_07330 [Neisseria dumasiana]